MLIPFLDKTQNFDLHFYMYEGQIVPYLNTCNYPAAMYNKNLQKESCINHSGSLLLETLYHKYLANLS